MFSQNMEERVSQSLPGAVFESFGRLLYTDAPIFVAPMRNESLVAALGGLPEGLLRECPVHDLLTSNRLHLLDARSIYQRPLGGCRSRFAVFLTEPQGCLPCVSLCISRL
jgi:hypothetical protein